MLSRHHRNDELIKQSDNLQMEADNIRGISIVCKFASSDSYCVKVLLWWFWRSTCDRSVEARAHDIVINSAPCWFDWRCYKHLHLQFSQSSPPSILLVFRFLESVTDFHLAIKKKVPKLWWCELLFERWNDSVSWITN